MKYLCALAFFLTLALPLSAQQIEGVEAIESSPFTKNPEHKLYHATDGDLNTYAVLYDSTPDGTDETRVPPKGNAPVTGSSGSIWEKSATCTPSRSWPRGIITTRRKMWTFWSAMKKVLNRSF